MAKASGRSAHVADRSVIHGSRIAEVLPGMARVAESVTVKNQDHS
jgi:hypothetical protein